MAAVPVATGKTDGGAALRMAVRGGIRERRGEQRAASSNGEREKEGGLGPTRGGAKEGERMKQGQMLKQGSTWAISANAHARAPRKSFKLDNVWSSAKPASSNDCTTASSRIPACLSLSTARALLARVRVCVRASASACVRERACVRACVRACRARARPPTLARVE